MLGMQVSLMMGAKQQSTHRRIPGFCTMTSHSHSLSPYTDEWKSSREVKFKEDPGLSFLSGPCFGKNHSLVPLVMPAVLVP
jgi:hypothetical protein